MCTDEMLLHPDPYPDRDAWCRARVAATEARLADAADPDLPTVLVNHYPLVRRADADPAHPEFALWCGTERTADWHVRFDAAAVVYGHLHIPRTTYVGRGALRGGLGRLPAGVAAARPRRRAARLLPGARPGPGAAGDRHAAAAAGGGGARRSRPLPGEALLPGGGAAGRPRGRQAPAEFTTVRHCARIALGRLGRAAGAAAVRAEAGAAAGRPGSSAA